MLDVTWTEWVRAAAMGLTFVASLWFISLYSRHLWETTPYGRNIMAVTLGIGATGAFGVFDTVSGSGFTNVLEACAWAFVAYALCRRRRLLRETTHDDDLPLGDDTIGAPKPNEET